MVRLQVFSINRRPRLTVPSMFKMSTWDVKGPPHHSKRVRHEVPSVVLFAPKSSYGEIFFISFLELVHGVLTPKMKKKMEVTDFVSEKMAVEKCLNFDKSVIITRCSLLC